jgi:predicted transposase/invertase (TIGR01784 family)
MAEGKNYIRFDWAMKRLLRRKADFVVINGFLSSLLGEKMEIIKVLESEGNKKTEDDKFNRVDILVEDSHGAKIIIEIQNSSEISYFQRILYGTSKVITEYIKKGENYKEIVKVYSISIVYFALGQGKDYVYRGTTEFRGIHENDILQYYNSKTDTLPRFESISEIFPEYYILRVEDFDKVATTPLDEWIHFLKTSDIPDAFTAPGLPEAREKLAYDSLSLEEQKNYLRYMDSKHYEENAMYTAKVEGKAEMVIELYKIDMPREQMQKVSGFSAEKIDEIIREYLNRPEKAANH